MSALEARQKLDDLAVELGQLSTSLADVSRTLEPIEKEYRAFIDDFEIGLYNRSVNQLGYKLPSKEMRLKLALRAMDPELFGRYTGYDESRKRMRKRISDLRYEIDAQRSILSAAKAELEATR